MKREINEMEKQNSRIPRWLILLIYIPPLIIALLFFIIDLSYGNQALVTSDWINMWGSIATYYGTVTLGLLAFRHNSISLEYSARKEELYELSLSNSARPKLSMNRFDSVIIDGQTFTVKQTRSVKTPTGILYYSEIPHNGNYFCTATIKLSLFNSSENKMCGIYTFCDSTKKYDEIATILNQVDSNATTPIDEKVIYKRTSYFEPDGGDSFSYTFDASDVSSDGYLGTMNPYKEGFARGAKITLPFNYTNIYNNQYYSTLTLRLLCFDNVAQLFFEIDNRDLFSFGKDINRELMHPYNTYYYTYFNSKPIQDFSVIISAYDL